MINKIKLILNKKQRLQFAFLFTGVLIVTFLEMIGIGSIPVFIKLLLEPDQLFSYLPENSFTNFINNKDYMDQVLFCAIFLLAFFTLKNIFFFTVNFFQAVIFRDLNIQNSKKLFQSYLYSPYSYHLNRNPAIITRNVLGDVLNANSYVESLMNFIREILIVIVIFILLLLVDPITSLSVFSMMGLFTIIFYFLVKTKITNLTKVAQYLRGVQVKLINQVFGAIKDTKILARELFFIHEFKDVTKGVERANFFSQVVNKSPRLIMEVLAIFSILLVTLLFAINNRSIDNMIPTLSLLGVATIRLIPAFNAINTTLAVMRKTAVSFNLTVNELTILEKYKDKKNSFQFSEKKEDKLLVKKGRFLNKNIELKNISYQYPNSSKNVLKNISFTIKSGSSVAIIGPTGSGKTTLANIILGLLKPTSGEVMIDGKNIDKDYLIWQKQIGYIPQDIYLIDDTIKKNVAFGISDKDIDENKIKNSIKLAQLNDFISSLPSGLDTIVGDRGTKLSGGQLQRVGIARALYRKTEVLVLDEATSSLDMETEKKLIKDIESVANNNTSITVTHRLSTIKNCDKIFLLSNGELIDQGNFDELTSRNNELMTIKKL